MIVFCDYQDIKNNDAAAGYAFRYKKTFQNRVFLL